MNPNQKSQSDCEQRALSALEEYERDPKVRQRVDDEVMETIAQGLGISREEVEESFRRDAMKE